MNPSLRRAKEPYNPLRPNRPPPRRTPAPSQRPAPAPSQHPSLLQRPAPAQRPSLSQRLASSQRLAQLKRVKEEPEPEYEDSSEWPSFTLTTTKSALLSGQRYHVMRLHSRYVEAPDPDDPTGQRTVMVPERVNISDPEMFKRPVRLHRRDATEHLGGKNESPEPADEEEKKRLEFKAERARRREELMSKVAPDGGGRSTFRSRDQKKTQQVFQSNAAQTANRKMRYEEEYPWFVEDADKKQTWQGQREHSMSNGEFAVLYLDHEKGSFSMIPVEKWYRFNRVKKGRKLTEEEIKAGEKKMTDKEQPGLPSWAKKAPEEFVETEKLTHKETELYYKNNIHRRKIVMNTVKGRSENMKGSEELDFNDEELFDNDDAGGVLGEFGNGDEGEAAAKDAAKRIRDEQLSANVFGSRTHKDYDEEKRKMKALKFVLKDHGKKVSKALKRREGNHTYDSDEEDPYINKLLSGSENESDSDSEAEAEEFKKWKLENVRVAAEKEAEAARKLEAKKETAKRAAEKRKAKKRAEIGESGATNSTIATPALISHSISESAGNGAKSRKRSRSPESPESSIKRIRNNMPSSNINSPFTPVSSPPIVYRKKRPRSPEPERPLKPSGVLKRRRQSKTPTGDTQPVPGATNTESASPTVPKSPSPSTNTTPPLLITDEEIIAALRMDPQGVAIKDLANTFKSRLKGGSNDVQALAQRLKQFGSKEGSTKRWKLKQVFH